MKVVRWIGPAVFVFAFALRLIGIGWGLPNSLHHFSYHPDEPINLSASRLVDPAHLNFVPGWYNYGTFFLTLTNIASDYVPAPEQATPDAMAAYDAKCLLAGRIVSALAGAGIAWVLWALLIRRTHWIGALAGALAAAFAPGLVVHSRFDTVDITAAFLLALSLHFALKLLPDKNGVAPTHYLRWTVLSCLFAGLSAGTKYLGAVVILALFVAIFCARRPDAWRHLILGAAAAIVAFIVSTPGAVLDFPRFKEGFGYETAHAASGHGLVFVDVGPSWLYHLVSMSIAAGTLVLVFGLSGVLGAAFYKRPWALVLLAFAAPYYGIISLSHVDFLRYTFPLLIPVCAGFGWLIGLNHRERKFGRFIVALGIVGLGMQLWTASEYTAWMVQPDPRDQVGQLFKQLATSSPKLTVGVIDDPWFYTPALYPNAGMPRPLWQRQGPQEMDATQAPHVVYFQPGESPDYIALSTLEYFDKDRLLRAANLSPGDLALVQQWADQKRRLIDGYSLLGGQPFGGPDRTLELTYREDMAYVHPYVYVWKRKDLP